jgi:hypothetical protein
MYVQKIGSADLAALAIARAPRRAASISAPRWHQCLGMSGLG